MGFEVVVRPVVFPNIRPAPAQSSPAPDNAESGIATINGSSGQFLDLQYSWSASTSQSKARETKRRYDTARVYQMDDEGNVNKDNFVDINVANKSWYKDGNQDKTTFHMRVKKGDNIEITDTNRIETEAFQSGGL
jgi:hypothetical protein